MKKIISSIYTSIKLVILVTMIYVAACFYTGVKDGFASLSDLFSKPYSAVKKFLNTPVGGNSVIIEEDTPQVTSVRQSGEVKGGREEIKGKSEKKAKAQNNGVATPPQIINNHIIARVGPDYTFFIITAAIVIVVVELLGKGYWGWC
ncbi:MAG: hypothetical protein AAF380_02785 [Bacteroidota bacterium]